MTRGLDLDAIRERVNEGDYLAPVVVAALLDEVDRLRPLHEAVREWRATLGDAVTLKPSLAAVLSALADAEGRGDGRAEPEKVTPR